MEQFSSDIRERIRHARGKFAAMAITYFIGNFNDNFYKEAALLIAVSLNKPRIQSYITIIFTLPFLVFAAAAGWCADHFEKRTVIIAAKLLELTAMIFGALGMLYTNWTLILIMVGI
jgi:acyl-[acyl-carrier-protein]-phospholipid O-acyltransferase/long-chain-fatty-acid--[acyl-carrier-protein] ligase